MQSWIALPKMPTIFEWCSGDIVGDFKAVTTVINPNMYDEMIPTFNSEFSLFRRIENGIMDSSWKIWAIIGAAIGLVADFNSNWNK